VKNDQTPIFNYLNIACTSEVFFDKVYLAHSIDGTVWISGYVLWILALGLAIWASFRNRLQERTADPTPRPSAKPSSPFPPSTPSRCGGSWGRTRSLRELEYDAPASEPRSDRWLEAPS